MKTSLRVCFVVIASLFLVPCANATTIDVHVGAGGGTTFTPDPVFIQPGDTVHWIWDFAGHSVTSGSCSGIVCTPNGLFDTGLQGPPFTFSFMFNSAGTFPYYCSRHGSMMTGTINVVAPSPTPTPSTTPLMSPTPTSTPVTTPTPGCGGVSVTAAAKDNTLYEDPTGELSNGQGVYFFVGRTLQPAIRRGLIAFDLSSIPTNAIVTGATLTMYLSNTHGGTQTVTLSTVSQNWGEGASDAGDPGGSGTQAAPNDATWVYTFYNTSSWTNLGGDFSGLASASTMVSGAGVNYTWTGSGLLADVQGWVSNPGMNHGWVVRGNEVTAGAAQGFNSTQNKTNKPQLTVVYQLPCATPTPTPSPVNISGTMHYCSNPTIPPIPGVTLTLAGTASGSTSSDGSGNYSFLSLPSGGNYTVTPSKAAIAPASVGINTVDVIAMQRHFLNIGTPLSGCRLTAGDVNGISGINTVDVVATQRFFIGLTTGIANVGKYQFNPVNRTYSGIITDQTVQDYNGLIFGDVATSFVH